MKKLGVFMKLILWASLPAVLMTAACSENSSPSDNVMERQEVSHNYRIKEGQNYGYVSGISDEDRANGKAASELHLFRYLGEKDGVHTIQQVEEDGSVLLTASCSDPCQFMKLKAGSETERVEYNPDSLGGAVMQDALTGQLEVADAKTTRSS